MAAGDLVDTTIRSLVAGGAGLGRLADGRIVLVEGGLPGEVVRARLTDDRARHALATVADVLEPSPHRVAVQCPEVAAGCGGCDLWHLARSAQPAAKAEIVVDALRRLGGIDDVAVKVGPALPDRGYRTGLRAGVAGERLGFRRRRSHEIHVVGACAVAHPALDEIVRDGRFPGAAEVELRLSAAFGDRVALVHPVAGEPRVPADVVVVGAEVPARRRPSLVERVGGVDLRVTAGAFFQSSAAGAEALVAAVQHAGGAELATAGRVVDAYAGVGLFGATVAPPDAAVVAVERSAVSAADARANLAHRRARVVERAVERWRAEPADVVVADPARSGLGRAGVEVLSATAAAVVVLVSCDPAALGRDTRLLVDAGYRLASVSVVDLFPETHHVEAVSRFERR